MSPRRGRMPRPKALPKVTREGVARILASPVLAVPTEVAPSRPPAASGEPQAILTPGEAIYGCLSWLANRPQLLEVGADRDHAEVAALADEFCIANKINRPRSRNWHRKVVVPGAPAREEARSAPAPEAPERPVEDPDDRQARMVRTREQLRGRRSSERVRDPGQFSTPDPQEGRDRAGRTSSDRVADLAAGMTAHAPLSFSGGYEAVPFDSE